VEQVVDLRARERQRAARRGLRLAVVARGRQHFSVTGKAQSGFSAAKAAADATASMTIQARYFMSPPGFRLFAHDLPDARVIVSRQIADDNRIARGRFPCTRRPG